MAEFADELDYELARRYRFPGVKRPVTHRQGLTARMNALQKAHGGSAPAAAASAGIPARTWRDWRSGTHPPSARGQRRIEGAYARQIIAPAITRLVTAGSRDVTDIHVFATVVVDPDTPGRKGAKYTNATPERWFRAEGIKAMEVIHTWLHHGAEAAAQKYEALVKREYGEVFAFQGLNVKVELFP